MSEKENLDLIRLESKAYKLVAEITRISKEANAAIEKLNKELIETQAEIEKQKE